ncbi:MAG: glycosyltransferase [Caulobacteraceae bacterium]|nr:glycosyltransferase [Caulobacteraceae bacterium]
MSPPRLDVFVPCYNYGRYLAECVLSVLSETSLAVRVLIIDDASIDGSSQIAKRLASQDPRVSAISHATNLGHIATYNEGLAWATGDYVLLLSADDMVAPGALGRAVALMEAEPSVAFVYGHAIQFQGAAPEALESEAIVGRTTVLDGQAFIRRVCERPINPVEAATAVVRGSVQRAVGGYRPEFPHAGDLEMWLRCAAHGDVGRIEATQAYVRLHGENMREGYGRIADLRQRHAAIVSALSSERQWIPQARRSAAIARGGLAQEALTEAEQAFDKGRPCKAAISAAREISPAIVLSRAFVRLSAKRLIRSSGLGQKPASPGATGIAAAGSSPEPDTPEVSLIMSTRDRAQFLPPCLESLEAIRSNRPWQLVIVDNGSSDATWSILQTFASRTHLHIKILQEPQAGLSFARNAGVRAASAPILAFTDDDCYPQPDFIDAVARVFAESEVGFMGGRILLHDPEDAPVSITCRTERVIFPAGAFLGTGEIQGACMAFRREVFQQVGLFDTAFGAGGPLKAAEDSEMVARACFAGWNGGFFPEAVIRHHHRRRHEGAARVTWSYDYSRGAFFAKVLLEHPRVRRRVLRAWYWDTPVFARPTRRNLLKFGRELRGAAHYLLGHALRASAPAV